MRRRMGDQRLQARREAFDLRRPVGQQRRRGDQQAWLPLAVRLALEHKQQRQHLNGLAQPHVVGQASAEAEFREQIQPAHAHLLVGPQRTIQRRAGIDLRQSLGAAQALSASPPATGRRPLEPSRLAIVSGGISRSDIGAGEHAHGFSESRGPSPRRCARLRRSARSCAQPLAVNFDPAPSHQRQPIGLGQQLPDLRSRSTTRHRA